MLPFLLVLGCAHRSLCPPKYAVHYTDEKRDFILCLPAGVKESDATAGQVVFTGFAVPAGTNLEQKTLIIAPGKYDMLQGAKAAGGITANGIYLKRALLDDGSAGHSTLHVIYTWTNEKKSVHFDFTYRSVNVGNFDPANRPKEYDRAAQIKWSEDIMSTFTYRNAPASARSASR